VEDLLRRAPVEIDTDAVAGYLNGASVLVTGGGGSIAASWSARSWTSARGS